MAEWLIPALLAAAAIWPLAQATRWIHKHVQGLGLLLTNNPQGAVLVYYLTLVPGVALHEGSQWLLAKLLRVKVKKFRLWPEKQRGGTVRLGLVEIDDRTDQFRATLVGVIPVVMGILVIGLIGALRFDVESLLTALATGDVQMISAGLNAFLSTPDFFLWFYLIFAIANTMLPEPHDRINWWFLAGICAAFAVFLLVLDLSILLQAMLTGPFADAARLTSLALILSLAIDLFMIAIIWLAERIFSRVLNREVEYQ